MSANEEKATNKVQQNMKTDLPSGLTPEQLEHFAQLAREQASKVMAKIPALGAVAWLMMQQSNTKHIFLNDLEWRVMPALALDQAKLYMRDSFPVAYVSWAKLNEACAARYKQTPHHLAPADWKSGDQVWLVDVITPFGGAKEVLQDLRANVFAGQSIHQLIPADLGQSKSVSWPAVAKA
jgi:cytolysin-activating lysine-acyltransferase